MEGVAFQLIAEDRATRARAGLLRTAHGVVETPVFMPVGTQATVKALTQEMLEELGARIILANTYHLFLRPGEQVIRELGGLHRFMAWERAILTDSGGYQILSLAPLRVVREEGVHFQSHLDGSRHVLTPERAIEIQVALGSDILMVLDECLENPAERAEAERAVRLTTAWARRSKVRFEEFREQGQGTTAALFGIIQGSLYADLRRRSLEELLEIGFDGYAIGGLSVGEEKAAMLDMVEYVAGLMPRDRPRYLMGVGTPADLVRSVQRGVDMFDCVLPTRNARMVRSSPLAAPSTSRMPPMPAIRARWTKTAPAGSVGDIRGRISATSTQAARSSRPSSAPITMCTSTLTRCGRSGKLSSLATSQSSRKPSCAGMKKTALQVDRTKKREGSLRSSRQRAHQL